MFAVFICGCATNIAKMPITARDGESYNNPHIKKGETKKDVDQSIRVAIIPEDKNSKDEVQKKLTDMFRDDLDTAISNLADFESIPRSELSAVMTDKEMAKLSSDDVKDVKIESADYMLIFKISSYALIKNDNVVGGLLSKAQSAGENKSNYKAEVKAKITLLNVDENKKEFTKSISGVSSNLGDQGEASMAIPQLAEACENAVKDFVTQFAIEFAPPAVVEQTKGAGHVALISMGKNFGIMKNMKIEFFEIKEKDGKKRSIPFAYGKVLEVDEDSCWVEVEDFEEAGVKENHFARVRRDQSKSFIEKIQE